MSKGLFVTLEGLEGAETELRASQLQRLLTNYSRKARLVEHITLSDGQETSPNAIVHFLSEASALYMLEQEIMRLITSVDVLIVSRYLYYQLAYAVGRGIPLSWGKQVLGRLRKPDIVFYLDVCVKECIRTLVRSTNTPMSADFEQKKLLEEESTYLGYISLIAEEPTRYYVLNCDTDEENIQRQLYETVMKHSLPLLLCNS